MSKSTSIIDVLGLTVPDATSAMDHWLKGDGLELQSNIGHFMMWFGTTEMFLTRTLAFTLNMRDLQRFDLLCKGMDARVKCERLRKSIKQYHSAGPVFLAELKRFEEKSIPLRNRISHSWPVQHDGTVYFCGVKSGVFIPETFVKDGTEMPSLDFFLEGFWLNVFSKHIYEALKNAVSGGPLESNDQGPNPQPEAH